MTSKQKQDTVIFFIDNVQFKTQQKEVTAKFLLEQFANEDPSETTLVLKHGNQLTKYEDDNASISLNNGMHFVVFYDGPTPVSLYGPAQLRKELDELGYQVELVRGLDNLHYAVIKDFEVPLGKFAGRVIDLGIPAMPNFPQAVGASIHVRSTPQLYEKADSLPGVRNIQDSKLGSEWRYWSKNFNWNQQNKQSARRLMSQIAGVFNDA